MVVRPMSNSNTTDHAALYHAAKRQARAAVKDQDPGTHPWLTIERSEEIQMIAAIGAAVSEERERCATICRNIAERDKQESASDSAEEIEHGE